MPLTIPDYGEPADNHQSVLFQTDIDALAAGIGGDGVLSGCAVSAQGSPNNTVAVASGRVVIGGTVVAVASGNVTMPSADATNPRWVLISVDNTGAKAATAGTAAADPILPAVPSNSVALAAVWWPANDTTVASSQITDKRAIVRPYPSQHDMPTTVAGVGAPGVPFHLLREISIDGSTIYYSRIRVAAPITLTEARFRVTSAAGSGNTGRMALYRAGTGWQPGALLWNVTGIAINSTGAKSSSISSLLLSPGDYLLALWATAGITVLVGMGGVPGHPLRDTLTDQYSYFRTMKIYRDAATFTSWADPGTAWDSVDTGDQGSEYPVFLKWTA